ncbi:MAG: hypothetical protein Q8927_19010 [Bacteroidota bacterium]|nr:hypothetical protein [Bacteroidota bacterium]MDP4218297.1 hypothetical protein [Bacteroidota bacterium]MDP4245259.1 hypothetical protein [Bacteroidota bacterium]MDP4254807.1 hypothetical protein [Bacteroidota bacterium]MDP4259428.1 hypothetical protein [Bacteroidota bacterium]
MNANRLLFAMICVSALTLAGGGSGLHAQDLGKIGKAKPFTFSGSIGGGVNFYHSNETLTTRDPFTWNLYGSFMPTIYNFSLPFSFVVNQYSRSYTTPFAQFGISPTYKWIKLHLGYRSINFSPLTFAGQSFKGAGIELTPGIFRFAAFYGSLNKAISEDTTSGRLAMPQYGRIGYGARIGVGTEANHIDLIYFHAKDDSGSVRLINDTVILRPQENTVIGTSFKLTLIKRIVWTADLAASALTQDLAAQKVVKDTLTKSIDKLFSSLIDYRNSTRVSLSGQSQLTLLLRSFNTTIGYRRVQPDFKSLGVPYMLNDIEAWQWNAGGVLSRGKVNLNANVTAQHNDISHNEESELHNLTASFNMGAMLSPHANLGLAATLVNLRQTDGTNHISDSIRQDEQVYNFSITPSFSFGSMSVANSLGFGLNYSLLNDNNPVTSPSTNSHTMTGTMNYTCSFLRQASSLNGSLIYNRYAQDSSVYTSYGINAGAAAQFLKDKTLGVQVTVGYMFNHYTLGTVSNNVTGGLNAHYTVAKRHSFSAYFNIVSTPPSSSSTNLQQKVPYTVSTTNTAGGLSYNYSF